MRTSAVAFAALLMLLLLATRAHGIRLDRQLHEAINNSKKQMGDPKSAAAGETSIADSVKKNCTPDGRRCSAGKVEKALAHADETVEAKQHQVSSAENGQGMTVVDGEATQQADRHKAEAASHGSQDASRPDAEVYPRAARHRQQAYTYPDLMDIAGMDYSPATRKPPIHN